MVARVVMRALILNLATTMPLMRPNSTPTDMPARMPTVMLSVALMPTAQATPEQATTEPTDMSNSPEARQNSMPQATMPDMETASPSPRMLIRLAKLGTSAQASRNRMAKITSMPY
ncbi:hypothetical protein D3C84_565030 [compost metagenome]